MKKFFSLFLSLYLTLITCLDAVAQAKPHDRDLSFVKKTHFNQRGQKINFIAMAPAKSINSQEIIAKAAPDIEEKTAQKSYKEDSLTCITMGGLGKLVLASLVILFTVKAIEKTTKSYRT